LRVNSHGRSDALLLYRGNRSQRLGRASRSDFASDRCGNALVNACLQRARFGWPLLFPDQPRNTAERQRRIERFEEFATSAGEADSYLISTLNPHAQGPQELDIYFVPRDMAGLEPAGLFEGLGLAGNASAPLNLKGVVVSAENRLGAEKSGLEVLLQVVLPHFQIGSAAVSVGIAGTAFERAVTHVTSRKYHHANQSALAQIPRVQYLVAEMAMELRATRAYLRETIRKALAGEADAMLDVLAVKAKASEALSSAMSRPRSFNTASGISTSLSFALIATMSCQVSKMRRSDEMTWTRPSRRFPRIV
jgi:Acyl-CoA dehydrogenase, C-terminal domain